MTNIYSPIEPRREDPQGHMKVDRKLRELTALFTMGEAESQVPLWDEIAQRWVAGNPDPLSFDQNGAEKGMALIWNGTNWVPASVAYVYDRDAGTVTIINDSTEQTIYSQTILANDLTHEKMLRLTVFGAYLHNNAGGDTLTVRVKFGGTIILHDSTNFAATTGANQQPWRWDLLLANLGATNAQVATLTALYPKANKAAPTVGIGDIDMVDPMTAQLGMSVASTIDTTADKDLVVTVQWSAASVNNMWRKHYALLELL